jgi:hypothetical protein
MISSLTQLHFTRPRVVVRAKKDDFVAPTEAPGEGRRKPPSYDEDGKPKKVEEVANPIKKLIKKFFKIEEIDYEKFRKESMWAIRIKDKNKK